jgi:hypothetical protein
MKYFTNLIKRLIVDDVPKPLGRWKIEYCKIQLKNKIDLSNEDHCGPCGKYALDKIKSKEDNIIFLPIIKK